MIRRELQCFSPVKLKSICYFGYTEKFHGRIHLGKRVFIPSPNQRRSLIASRVQFKPIKTREITVENFIMPDTERS